MDVGHGCATVETGRPRKGYTVSQDSGGKLVRVHAARDMTSRYRPSDRADSVWPPNFEVFAVRHTAVG